MSRCFNFTSFCPPLPLLPSPHPELYLVFFFRSSCPQMFSTCNVFNRLFARLELLFSLFALSCLFPESFLSHAFFSCFLFFLPYLLPRQLPFISSSIDFSVFLFFALALSDSPVFFIFVFTPRLLPKIELFSFGHPQVAISQSVVVVGIVVFPEQESSTFWSTFQRMCMCMLPSPHQRRTHTRTRCSCD